MVSEDKRRRVLEAAAELGYAVPATARSHAAAQPGTADVVRNDDHLGLRLVVDYLAASGHRAIAHLGGMGGGTG
jgi:DNA-binding LacI/PurR family transcriptional regulator